MSRTYEVMTSPADVAKLLQDSLDTQPTIIDQPNDDNLLALKEKLLDILQTISYDRADGFHHVVGVIHMESAYMADHSSTAIPTPKCLGLWNDKIAKDATVVEMKKAKAIHKTCSKDYKIWKTAKDGCKKLICAAVEEVYINKPKDGTTFFHKIFACDLLKHLETNSTGLHALNIVAMCLNMLLLYKNAGSMPDFILAMEEAQEKAKHAELPILDIELAMYAATSVLQLGNYKKETDNGKMGRTQCFHENLDRVETGLFGAYARGVNRQWAGVTDEPFSRVANLVTLPATHDVIDALAGLLDNLALAATSNRTNVQQLTLGNLTLTTSVAMLMAANKKLTKTIPCCNLTPQGHSSCGGHGGASAPVVSKQYEETTVGCMGTRNCILAKPVMRLVGNRYMMRLQWLLLPPCWHRSTHGFFTKIIVFSMF
jgi:hypothetical protein